MSRRFLAIGAVLSVGLGCADAPTAVAPLSDSTVARQRVLSAGALAAMRALLDDPFVHDVVAQADHTRTDPSVQQIMQDMMSHIAAGDPHAILRALTEAHQALDESGDNESIVNRAALSLTLVAVQTVLDSAVQAQAGEGDALALDLRGGHND